MAYVLEKILPADQEKILADANCDQEKRNWLIYRKHFKYNPELSWTVERERNIYMFLAPRTREQSGEDHYYFYFNSRLYGFHLEGGPFVGKLVAFDDAVLPPQPLLDELQREIVAAFAVYGRSGDGDHGGDWMYAVKPEFKDRNMNKVMEKLNGLRT